MRADHQRKPRGLTSAAKVATVSRKSVVKVITKLVVPVVHAGKVEKRLK
jgi:hypothetical protein